ncbi:MAG: hypothetical protein R2764_11030 [Bacteroidales bacterium]
MNLKLVYILIAFIFLIGSSVIAQDVKEIPETDNTVPAITLLPSPGEVLNALSKIGQVDWSNLVSYNKFYNYKGRNRQALNIGIRVADAFVALHDEDKANFGDMNNVIYSLSEELSISSLIEEQKNKLQELSQKDDWVLLIIELNTMNGQLQEELIKQKEYDIVLLSNVGAFFEGVFIISSHFASNYDVSKVGLLKQIALVNYYIGEIDNNKELKEDATVDFAYNGLIQIKSLLDADADLSINTVGRMQAVASSVVNSITK